MSVFLSCLLESLVKVFSCSIMQIQRAFFLFRFSRSRFCFHSLELLRCSYEDSPTPTARYSTNSNFESDSAPLVPRYGSNGSTSAMSSSYTVPTDVMPADVGKQSSIQVVSPLFQVCLASLPFVDSLIVLVSHT